MFKLTIIQMHLLLDLIEKKVPIRRKTTKDKRIYRLIKKIHTMLVNFLTKMHNIGENKSYN